MNRHDRPGRRRRLSASGSASAQPHHQRRPGDGQGGQSKPHGLRRQTLQAERAAAAEHRKTVEAEDRSRLPVSKGRQCAVVNVVPVGMEWMLPAGGAADDGQAGVGQRQDQCQQRRHEGQRLGAGEAALHSQPAQDEAEHQAARIAQEHAGRMEIVAQKGQAGAGQGGGGDGIATEQPEEDAGDGGGAGGEPVDAVEQVEGVAHADEPEHGQRDAPLAQRHHLAAWQRHGAHHQPHRHGQRGRQHLTQELRAVRQLVQVVDDAEQEHDAGAEDEPGRRRRQAAGLQEYNRCGPADEGGDAAEFGNETFMDAVTIDASSHAPAARHPKNQRGEKEREGHR